MIISMHGLKISLHEHSRNSTQFQSIIREQKFKAPFLKVIS